LISAARFAPPNVASHARRHGCCRASAPLPATDAVALQLLPWATRRQQFLLFFTATTGARFVAG
jgi:hypothetical protein